MNTSICNEMLEDAAKRGDLAEVMRLIPLSDPKADDSFALRLAADRGYVECVRVLLAVSDPKARSSAALLNAVRGQHEECVALLAPLSDISEQHFFDAVMEGNGVCVSHLIAAIDVHANAYTLHKALVLCGQKGNVPLLKKFLEVSDPKFNKSQALVLAIQCKQLECVEILYPLSNFQEVVRLFQSINHTPDLLSMLQEREDNARLRQVLHTVVTDAIEPQLIAKTRKI